MTYYLVTFSKKTGKIYKCLSGQVCAMLMLWALQHTTKSRDTIIFDENLDMVKYYEGAEECPKVYDETGVKATKYCADIAALVDSLE